MESPLGMDSDEECRGLASTKMVNHEDNGAIGSSFYVHIDGLNKIPCIFQQHRLCGFENVL